MNISTEIYDHFGCKEAEEEMSKTTFDYLVRVIEELEAENEQLKDEVQKLKQALESYTNDEDGYTSIPVEEK